MRVISRPDPESGNLFAIEFANVPFEVKRVYWIQDFVPFVTRGNHAHKKLTQIMILQKGELDLELIRGRDNSRVKLSTPGDFIFIANATWRRFTATSKETTVLVLADREYEEHDYIRDFAEYSDWFEKR